MRDAKALEAAGAFAVVLEVVPAELAERVTDALSIPTIGIGAGNGCDAQVNVWQDLVGLTPAPRPKFVARTPTSARSGGRGREPGRRTSSSGAYPARGATTTDAVRAVVRSTR